jgi:hypothetical protein
MVAASFSSASTLRRVMRAADSLPIAWTSLIVGKAMSGAFLAHGYQANRLIAFNDSGVLVHAEKAERGVVVDVIGHRRDGCRQFLQRLHAAQGNARPGRFWPTATRPIA